jgi:HPt (histidine-containing phosphotransfer) domain-containing protein
MGRSPGVDELLLIARQEFASRLPDKVAELEAFEARTAWPELRAAAHMLRGSAATYGFQWLSAIAASVEDQLLAVACTPDPAAASRIGEALAQARLEADRAGHAAVEDR